MSETFKLMALDDRTYPDDFLLRIFWKCSIKWAKEELYKNLNHLKIYRPLVLAKIARQADS